MFRSLVVFLLVLVSATAPAALAVPAPRIRQLVAGFSEPVCLLVVPDGSGPAFGQARAFGGATADATVAVQVWSYDESGPVGPWANFDPLALTLRPATGSARGCAGTAVATADASTGADGWTQFSLPPHAGGWSEAATQVLLWNGALYAPACSCGPLPILFNSPDLNGDRRVDLADITLFAQDYFAGVGAFRSDLHWDGVVDLSDLAVFSRHLGADCP